MTIIIHTYLDRTKPSLMQLHPLEEAKKGNKKLQINYNNTKDSRVTPVIIIFSIITSNNLNFC